MNSREVREKFLCFFEKRGHLRYPSSSLVPSGDETLLFTNAGMVQFKSAFTGESPPPAKRVTTCQKCMRAGGKHNDLENVGKTQRHHTFFEMLGNFSFGDYFKSLAVEFAWELVVKEYGIDPSRLYFTVFREDDETVRLWKKISGFSDERILRMGEKDNFWSMGDTGPCGPCSEIIYDRGENHGCGKPECAPGCDCDRFLELWNLVFMEYERDKEGNLKKLPHPSIDTGMGLERICSVLQGVEGNYDTDLFRRLIERGKEVLGCEGKNDDEKVALRVVSDHARAITFLLADGVYFSNEGRGYVLRRILRRAVRFGWKAGRKDPFLQVMCDEVIENMGDVYPELREKRETILKMVKVEEEKFLETIEKGIETFNEEAEKVKDTSKVLPGFVVFKLYDTFGFPPDLTKLMAEERGLSIDEEGFEREMQAQKERSRRLWEEKVFAEKIHPFFNLAEENKFTGYERLRERTKVLALAKEGKLTRSIQKGEGGEILLESSPFYGESGGQIGDTGWIYWDGGKARVKDTKRSGRLVISKITVLEGEIEEGKDVLAEVDEERRLSIMRNHTATHLLHSSLRKILGDHVRQSGSLVEENRLRFDFSHFQPMSHEEIEEVERTVNRWIFENRPVYISYLPLEEAKKIGALAFFDEKYESLVRVVSVEGVSMELCGGTHVKRTGEIGGFMILSEGSVASGVRRITAATGVALMENWKEMRRVLKNLSKELNADINEVPSKILQMKKKLKEYEQEINNLRHKLLSGKSHSYDVEDFKGVKIITGIFQKMKRKELGDFADRVKKEHGSSVVFFISEIDGRVEGACSISPSLVERLDASELLKKSLERVEGSGGGRRDFAQGGGKNPERMKEAIEDFKRMVRDTLSR